MDIQKLYRLQSSRFRQSRMQLLQRSFQLTETTSVLDIGGTLFNWQFVSVLPKLTLLNLGPRPGGLPAEICYIQGDATAIELPDSTYDLVYSNSVIEHLGTYERQRRMADEVRRLGRAYFVHTPNRYFPVEPHLLTPLIHYLGLPIAMQRRLLRNFTTWGVLTRPSAQEVEAFLEEVRLLTRQEMSDLFPSAIVHTEYLGPIAKSLIAIHSSSVGER